MTTEKAQQNVRMPPELRKRLQEFARMDGRTYQTGLAAAAALKLYADLREALGPDWHLIEGLARASGRETGELVAELTRETLRTKAAALFGPPKS